MSKSNAAESAAEELRRAILAGELVPGAMLPGERELSETLGVSRLTLRSALATLQSEGLIEKVHGSGNRVLSYRENGGVELVAHLARYALEGGKVPIDLLGDLLEFRRFIAIQILGVVAERATTEELRALHRQRAHLETLVDDARAFMQADLQFARLLVRATHNIALELLYNTVQRIIQASPGFEAAFGVNAPATLATYDLLLERLGTRDPERVQSAARKVLGPLDRKTLDRLAELARVMEPRPESDDVQKTERLKGGR